MDPVSRRRTDEGEKSDLVAVLRKCGITEELVPRFLEDSGLTSVAALAVAEKADIKELLMVLGQKKVQAGATTCLLRRAASTSESGEAAPSAAKGRRASLIAIVGTREWAAANKGRRLPPQLHTGTWVRAHGAHVKPAPCRARAQLATRAHLHCHSPLLTARSHLARPHRHPLNTLL